LKIGAEKKRQVIAMVVLLAIAIPLALYNFRYVLWGSNTSAAPPVPSTAPQTKVPGALPARDGSDPRLRLDILEASRKVKYEAGGRNIFTMEALPVPTPVAPPRPMGPPAPDTPTPTPPPPPIPLNYYGYANKPGEPRKIFLQQKGSQELFVAAQGDIVARRYRVVQFTPNSVTMEDVLTNNRQTIQLTVR
jgi:hypothetical protein